MIAALLAGFALTVDSASACPSADAIEAAVARLAPGGLASTAVVRVREADGGLVVSFTWAPGGPTESRLVAVGPGCAARAEAAAVVIASWAGAALPDAAPTPALHAGPAAPPASAVAVASERVLELSAAAALEARGARPGGRLEVGGGAASGLGWTVMASAFAEQDVALGPARSLWTRAVLAAGPRLRRVRGAWRAQVDAGPAVGLSFARGDGYDMDQRSAALNVGGSLGGRLGVGGRWGWLWFDARGTVWARRQRLVNESLPAGVASTSALPRADAQLAVGASFALP